MPRPLADDLWVLLLDEQTGRPLTDGGSLRAAVLLDLALLGRLSLEPPRWGGEKLRVSDPRPTGDAVLDAGLARLAVKPQPASYAVHVVVNGTIAEGLRDRLVARGVVRHQPGAFLKLTRNRPDPGVRHRLVRELTEALAGPDPSPHAVALVTLVNSVDVLRQVVADQRWTRKALRARAAELAPGLGDGDPATAFVVAVLAAGVGAASSSD